MLGKTYLPVIAVVSAVLAAPLLIPTHAEAQLKDRDGYDIVGIRLSERERENSRPVRLPDGRNASREWISRNAELTRNTSTKNRK